MGSPAPAGAPAQPAASPRGMQAGGKSHPLLHAASEPLSPAGEGAADAPFPTGALLPSSEETTPAPSGDQLGPAMSSEEAEQRKRRRERWEADVEAGQRWDLHRRLADISTDVEWLAREVERVRSELEVPLPPISELPEAERVQMEEVRRRRLNELLGNHCKKALAHITSHKWSWPFNAPVDTRQYPDYADMVKRPMDFGTIRRRIDAGAYRHPDDFLADVRLVFDNARLYNKPGSDVHVMANTLQERFEEKYSASVAPRVAEEGLVTQQEEDEARRQHLETTSRGDSHALEQQCALLVKYIDEVQALVADARSAAAALSKPVSRQEKEALVASLNVLPQGQFELAVGLVMSHHPGLQAYDDVAFDLDALDALTLRQMRSFVRACEAANAEAESSGAQPAAFSWPRLLLGAGLRPYRLPGASKRQNRRQAAARGPTGQQQALVKEEERSQQQQPDAQQGGAPPLQPQAQQASARPQGQAPGGDAVDTAAPPPSSLTPEEVAAAAAAAGLISPAMPLAPPSGELPAAGSAVGPAPLVAALPSQQGQAGGRPAAAPSPTVASSGPVAPLPAAARAAQQPAGSAPGQPTAAQLAAVAKAGPQQQQLLAQMHSLLSKVQMSQAAVAPQAAGGPAPKQGSQQQQQQSQANPGGN